MRRVERLTQRLRRAETAALGRRFGSDAYTGVVGFAAGRNRKNAVDVSRGRLDAVGVRV